MALLGFLYKDTRVRIQKPPTPHPPPPKTLVVTIGLKKIKNNTITCKSSSLIGY